MHVHVHEVRRQRQLEKHRGANARRHRGAIRRLGGADEARIANGASVDREVHATSRETGVTGTVHQTCHVVNATHIVHAHEPLGEAGPPQRGRPRSQGVGGGQRERRLAILREAETETLARERESGHGIRNAAPFRAGAPQEALPGRRVVEQLPNADGRTGTARGLPHLENPAPGGTNQRADAIRGSRLDLEVRHRADGGERLAAKAEAPHTNEIVRAPDLGGRVAGDGELRVLALHAASVVAHADAGAPALFHGNVDRQGAGVERVLDELLDDGGGALDHFAGGDLISDRARKDRDVGHTKSYECRDGSVNRGRLK
jgi:hypothetical protein